MWVASIQIPQSFLPTSSEMDSVFPLMTSILCLSSQLKRFPYPWRRFPMTVVSSSISKLFRSMVPAHYFWSSLSLVSFDSVYPVSSGMHRSVADPGLCLAHGPSQRSLLKVLTGALSSLGLHDTIFSPRLFPFLLFSSFFPPNSFSSLLSVDIALYILLPLMVSFAFWAGPAHQFVLPVFEGHLP